VSLLEYLRIIRRRWFVIVIAAVLAVAAGGLTKTKPTANTVTSYDATTVLLQTRALTQEQAQSRPGAVGYLETIATLVTIGEIPKRTAEEIGYEGTPQELAARIRTDSDTATGILRITATARDPEQAIIISKAFVTQTRSYLEERESDLAGETIKGLDARIADINAQIAALGDGALSNSRREAKVLQLEQLLTQRDLLLAPQPAPLTVVEEPYATPSREIAYNLAVPSGALRMGISGFLGLVLGVGIVLLGERLNTRVRTREEAEHHFGAPVLAEIPVLPKRDRDTVVSAVRPQSAAADAFGLLAVAISRREFMNGNGNGSDSSSTDASDPILVTSASHGEGKTTVAVNLAAGLAEMGKRVLLISADYRSTALHPTFDLPDQPGLSEALHDAQRGRPTLDPVVRDTAIPGLRIVTSGAKPERVSELLSSAAMSRAMREAQLRSDFVIIDAAPILAARDSAYLLNDVGSVLIVAGAGKVSSELAERASELLANVGAPIAGVVLNGSLDSPTQRAAGRLRRRGRRPERNGAEAGDGSHEAPHESVDGGEDPPASDHAPSATAEQTDRQTERPDGDPRVFPA